MRTTIVLRVGLTAEGLRLRAPQHCAKKAFEAVLVGRRAESAVAVDDLHRDAGDLACVYRSKWRTASEQCVDDAVVFFGLAGARGVDEPAAESDAFGRVLEHLCLRRSEGHKIALSPSPSDVRIATQRSD